MKKFTFILLLLHSFLLKAQDFSFSQFYEQPMLRNPALAGIFEGDVRVSGIFRNQWQSVTVPYRTGAASVEFKSFIFGKDYITAGLQTTYDEAGDIKLKRTAILPVINGHIPIDDQGTYIQLGFMGGPVSNQFDPTKAKYGDQFVNGSYDPSNPTQQQFSRTGINYFDLSTGISLNGNAGESFHYYVGGALYHANRPRVAFYTNDTKTVLNTKVAITTGIKMETSDNNSLEFYADYYSQSGHHQFITGGLYGIIVKQVTDDEENNKIAIYAGGLYRYNDAIIPVIKLDVYQLGIGLSYDVNISRLSTASNFRGGFELSLNYRMKFTNGYNSASARQVQCPAPGKGF